MPQSRQALPGDRAYRSSHLGNWGARFHQSYDAIDLQHAIDKLGGCVIGSQAFQSQYRMIAAGIALDADRSDGEQPAWVDSLDRRFFLGAQTANRQAGARERMAMQEFGGNAQLGADLADFILVKGREG